MSSLTTQQKATAFRALSAITYLAVTLKSFHSAFHGLIHFVVAICVCAAGLAMLTVQVWQLAGRPSLPLIDQLDDLYFPGGQGENVFSFRGRCLVDLILGVVLIFYIHEIFLGCVIWGIISAVVAVKDREVDLFQEVFVGGISSGDGSDGMMGGGAIPSPADGMVQGAYHSV